MNKGILGFKRVDHASWTVAALEPVIDFYSKLLGAEVIYRMGPLDAADIPRDADGRDWTDAHLGIPGAILSLAMLRLPDGFKIELFEYQAPVSESKAPLASNNLGSHHLGLEVEDLEQACSVLLEHGCAVFERIEMDEGPTKGSRFRYAKDPWGTILELSSHSASI